MILYLGTWVDQFLLEVKSEGMCAPSHLPDGPRLASAMPAPHAVTTRPRAYPFNDGVFDLSDCGIDERSIVPSFMIRPWLTWNLDRQVDRNNPLATRRHTGIRILATVTIAAQNSLDPDCGCHSGDTWALAVSSVL